jgi:hypothetical protein
VESHWGYVVGHGKKDPDPEPYPSGESVSGGGEKVEVFIGFTAMEPELADIGIVGITVETGVGLSKQGTSLVMLVPSIELKEMESLLSQTLTESDVLYLCQNKVSIIE